MTLREEVLKILTHIRPTDVTVQLEEDYDTELTKLAEDSVEQGVNEISSTTTRAGDDDFDTSVKKEKTASEANHTKNIARKKKKAQRQNRKKNRK